MKVSVIVPVYNVSNYIVKCIDSIVNGTLKDIEIIIVNDGSTDDSIKKVCDKFDDNRIKIIYKKNGGLASARNTGVRYAKGKYLFFVDSDDFIELNTLESMYEVACKGNYDIVYSDYYKYYEDGTKELIPLVKHYDKNNIKSLVTGMPAAVCKLIDRNLYLDNEIKFLEGYTFEDNAIIPYLASLAKRPYYLKKPYYYYTQREGSILNKKKYDARWEDIFFVLEYLKVRFKKHGNLNEYKEELEYIYIEYLLHAANLKFLDYKEGNKNIKLSSKVMKIEFPNWRKNKYYKQENIKYKIMCNLFYYRLIIILKLIRKVKRNG